MVYRYIGLILAVLMLLVPATAAANEQDVNISASGKDLLGAAGVWDRLGQRLHINGTVTKIGYRVWRVGIPTGNVTLSIYDVETDECLFSKVWGDAGELPLDGNTYQTVSLDSPLKLNREVRLCVEYYGGNETDYCEAGYFSGDKITGQYYTNYLHYGQWHDIGEAEEGSYHLSYIPAFVVTPPDENEDSIPTWAIALFGVAGAIIISTAGMSYVKKRRKA